MASPPPASCSVKWSMCWSAFISIHPALHLYSWWFAGAIQLNCLSPNGAVGGDWGFGWSALTIGTYHTLTYVYMRRSVQGRIREIFVKTQPLKSEVEFEQVIFKRQVWSMIRSGNTVPLVLMRCLLECWWFLSLFISLTHAYTQNTLRKCFGKTKTFNTHLEIWRTSSIKLQLKPACIFFTKSVKKTAESWTCFHQQQRNHPITDTQKHFSLCMTLQ